MYNDSIWRERGNRENCVANSVKIRECARKFPRGRWSFLVPGCEKKWYGTHTQKPDGEWDRTAESMMLNFAESGHPVFRFGKKRIKKQRQERSLFTWTEVKKPSILLTVISVNQLSIYGAVADLCAESARDSPSTWKHDENEIWESMVVPTEFPDANAISQTETILHYTWGRRTWWHAYIRYVESTHFLEIRKHPERECGFVEISKIGPVKDVKVYFHQGRHCIAEQFLAFASWTESTYVTETAEEIPVESIELVRTGKPVAKAKPRPKPAVTMSPDAIPTRERKWIDINPAPFNEGCFAVWKFMIRLMRHWENLSGEDDGAVRFDDLIEKFNVKFGGTSEWTIHAWTTFLAKGGGPKKRFQCSLNPHSSKHFL